LFLDILGQQFIGKGKALVEGLLRGVDQGYRDLGLLSGDEGDS
jgi:hypothetical protein